MKRIMAALLAMAVLACLCACGGKAELAPYAGEYTLFAYDIDGYVQEAAGTDSALTLKKNGTGRMTINGEKAAVTDWTVEDGVLTLISGGDTLTGTVGDGLLVLDLAGGVWYYAAAGADTSGVPVLTQ